jgi:amidase
MLTPMDATDAAFAGAARHVELVRSREVSARELTEIFLRRIDRYDGDLNAYRVTFDERALAEADQADARAKGGDRRPLLGVPIAIKDDIDVAGERTALGGDANDGPAAADAEVVRRLRTAGAVILGKTNVPELAITPWTESPTFGVTRNPWDRLRTPGGSSGGSAAAVAAGLAGAALGSDGAGSIRIPAGCCGVFGLKPENGRVPTAPWVEPWHGMTTWGPISRRVADSALFYDAVKGGGPSFAEAAVRAPGRLRIAVSVRTPLPGVQPDAEQFAAIVAVTNALRDLGHEVVDREIEYAPTLAANVFARYLGGIAATGRLMPHPERISRRTRGFIRIGNLVPAAAIARSKAAARADGEALWRPFSDVDLVMTPMFSRRPPRIGAYDGRAAAIALNGAIRFVPWCGAFNHTGQPAASIPAGFTDDGFPLAVQLVAPRDGEPALLALAAQLEQALGTADRRPPL